MKTTESGGPCGFHAGKKVKGRKRHIVTDTCGSLLAVQVHPANIQDNHGAVPLLKYIGLVFPKLRHIFADRVYRGKKLLDAIAEFGKWIIEIVTRSQSFGSFKAEPKRWVIERTLAWLNRCRRLSKDFEVINRERRGVGPPCQHSRALSASRKSLKKWALLLSSTLRKRARAPSRRARQGRALLRMRARAGVSKDEGSLRSDEAQRKPVPGAGDGGDVRRAEMDGKQQRALLRTVIEQTAAGGARLLRQLAET